MFEPMVTAAACGKTKFLHLATLSCAAEDQQGRVLSGLVLPFGQAGRTSLGTLTVAKDAVSIPENLRHVKLYRDHSDVGGTPVGYATAAEIKDDGLHMSFYIGATPDGDAALTDVREGIRDALSVELTGPETSGAMITAAKLSAVALVAVPAFDDARVNIAPSAPPALSTAAQVSQSILTASDVPRSGITLTAAADALTAGMTGAALTPEVTAALGEIKRSTHDKALPDQWLGQLWQGAAQKRKIIPTLTNIALEAGKLKGWRWVTPPEVDDYSGNLTEIPTNSPTLEHVEVEAKQIAAGHKIDRKYRDFGDTSFMQSYLAAMTKSYTQKSELAAVKFLITNATAQPSAKQKDLLSAAAKARQIITTTMETEPGTYLVHPDDMFDLLSIKSDDVPEYLKLVGVDPAAFISHASATKGKVIAYPKDAVLFAELPGAPIRVSAEDIIHGGSDEALFGYYAGLVTDSRGLISVEFGTD